MVKHLIYLAVFLISLTIHYKVFYWNKISQIGYASETPLKYLEHPDLYNIINILIIVAVFVLQFIFYNIHWIYNIIALFLLVYIYSYSIKIAYDKALKTANEIDIELEDE